MDEINEGSACTLNGGACDGQERESSASGGTEFSHTSSKSDEKAEKRKAWLKTLLTPP